jgi:hypothetical protein
VHEDRLDREVPPLELSPSEALRLAREGRRVLVRRDLPPDTSTPPDEGRRDGTDASGDDEHPPA